MSSYNLKGFGDINISLAINTDIEASDDNDTYAAIDNLMSEYAQEIEQALYDLFDGRKDVLKVEILPADQQDLTCTRDRQEDYWRACDRSYIAHKSQHEHV